MLRKMRYTSISTQILADPPHLARVDAARRLIHQPAALSSAEGMRPRYAAVLLNATCFSLVPPTVHVAPPPPKTKSRTALLMPSAPSTTSASCVDPSWKCTTSLPGMLECSEIEVQRLLKCVCRGSTRPISASRKTALWEGKQWTHSAYCRAGISEM